MSLNGSKLTQQISPWFFFFFVIIVGPCWSAADKLHPTPAGVHNPMANAAYMQHTDCNRRKPQAQFSAATWRLREEKKEVDSDRLTDKWMDAHTIALPLRCHLLKVGNAGILVSFCKYTIQTGLVLHGLVPAAVHARCHWPQLIGVAVWTHSPLTFSFSTTERLKGHTLYPR